MIAETIEWVPVEERMPREGQRVHVCSEIGVLFAQYERGIWVDAGHQLIMVVDITHWAEIKGPGDAK